MIVNDKYLYNHEFDIFVEMNIGTSYINFFLSNQ